ncbi:MAG TPA: stage II sporulation protein M [Bryobacteraceae bacterium]|nr:stage II sporulation protein M [Bryobacteraceae bacterium]
MIIDLPKFLSEERQHWTELESMLERMERYPERRLELPELLMFHELYERASADLAKIATFSSEPETKRYLERLVARAYGEIHETREKHARLNLWRWFVETFPQTFRRRIAAFWLSFAVTVAGCVFGGVAILIDPAAKQVLMPFGHLKGDPAERVRKEESEKKDRLAGNKSTFAAELMTHNTQVAIFTMALGVTWGAGTAIELFYNGVILGAVGVDYVMAGQTRFLLGWLLPHGAVEIPSILLGGQAGFLLAGALIGWGSRKSRRERLREISRDLVTIIGGAGVLLIWAGIIESFLSQYHEPVIPYAAKIAFGAAELVALTIFLARSGSAAEKRRQELR